MFINDILKLERKAKAKIIKTLNKVLIVEIISNQVNNGK